jgi:hypothetical protein
MSPLPIRARTLPGLTFFPLAGLHPVAASADDFARRIGPALDR